MSPKVAALALNKFFEPGVFVPMHYATFPVLASEGGCAGGVLGRFARRDHEAGRVEDGIEVRAPGW